MFSKLSCNALCHMRLDLPLAALLDMLSIYIYPIMSLFSVLGENQVHRCVVLIYLMPLCHD